MSTVQDDTEDFNMSATPQTFGPFTITFEKGPERTFVLHEVYERDYNAYQGVSRKAMTLQVGDNGERQGRFEGGEEADAVLVASCMVEVVLKEDKSYAPKALDGEGKPIHVSPAFVQSLIRRVSSRLYRKVRAMSAMDEDHETADFLKSRIKSDQEKLERLEKKGALGKDGQSITQHTSA